MMNKVESIIKAIRESDKYIVDIYMNGGCFQFYKVLASITYHAIPYYNEERDHVITYINGFYYDIRGKVPVNEEEGYLPMPRYMQKQAEEWRFSKRMALSLKECPLCGEPITI